MRVNSDIYIGRNNILNDEDSIDNSASWLLNSNSIYYSTDEDTRPQELIHEIMVDLPMVELI